VFAGDIRDDRLYRALYATDASIYQIVPDGVLLPRNIADVQAAVRACARYGVPITARGAGTGLTGGAVNRGLQLDCSRYLNKILKLDPHQRIAIVEPGVVLDQLNAAAKPFGLHFAPDVATSSRATIGGMIANNSCARNSVIYGPHGRSRPRLAGGLVRRIGWPCGVRQRSLQISTPARTVNWRATAKESSPKLPLIRPTRILARYPRILRSNGGYGLDRLHVNGRVNVERSFAAARELSHRCRRCSSPSSGARAIADSLSSLH